jgi:hypothetical protein
VDNVAEIVLFALLFLGWIVRTVLENRKRPVPRPVPPAKDRAPAAETRIPSETRVPAGDRAPERPPAPRPRRERAPEPRAEDAEAEEAARVEPPPQPTVAEVQGLQTGTLETATAAIADETGARRRAIVRRLGGVDGATPRDLARAGVLWSEVLGPPRATAGPHRPPSILRRGG